jgi:hypothetical protein
MEGEGKKKEQWDESPQNNIPVSTRYKHNHLVIDIRGPASGHGGSIELTALGKGDCNRQGHSIDWKSQGLGHQRRANYVSSSVPQAWMLACDPRLFALC